LASLTLPQQLLNSNKESFVTNEQFQALLWATPKAWLEEQLADLFVEASVKELIKQELARRNAFNQTSATA
jgi:hypothetical protein